MFIAPLRHAKGLHLIGMFVEQTEALPTGPVVGICLMALQMAAGQARLVHIPTARTSSKIVSCAKTSLKSV
jgi:hypothetical protein